MLKTPIGESYHDVKMIGNRCLLLLVAVAMLASCRKDDHTPYVKGKNHFTMTLDGDEREYFVHVPTGYDDLTPVPVVFMLHGTSGNGEEFYQNSGWKEVGEDNDILTVFPSSWKYCIFDEDGIQKTTTKWNTLPSNFSLCAGETARDDIRFLRQIIDSLKNRFQIDPKRIYLAGFSNGGQMAAKCAIEMSDVFAAIVESAGSFPFDTSYVPQRKLPVIYQVGNRDYGPGNSGIYPDIPMGSLDTLIGTPGLTFQNGRFYSIAHTHINSFDLDPAFTISGDTNVASIATYLPLSSDPANTFQFILIKGLAHAYPNGEIHPLKAAELNWNWMKQYSLP